MDLPNEKDLLRVATERRAEYLSDLRNRIDELDGAGGVVSYQTAIETVTAAVRFAAQIASINEFAAKGISHEPT
jgi:hypothetical protein